MFKLSQTYGLGLLVIVSFSLLILSLSNDQTTNIITGKVTHVVDGDTFYLDTKTVRIRLFGIDAPESHEIGFHSSRNHLVMTSLGKNIRCVSQAVDRYGRIVARCYLFSGAEINSLMLEEPYTKEWCEYSRNEYGTC